MEKSLDSHLDDMWVPYCSFLSYYTKIIVICVSTPSVFFPPECLNMALLEYYVAINKDLLYQVCEVYFRIETWTISVKRISYITPNNTYFKRFIPLGLIVTLLCAIGDHYEEVWLSTDTV